MIILLSPAKTLDFETPSPAKSPTQPEFQTEAARLITALRKYDAGEISALMKLSEKLGELNFQRYKSWKKSHSDENAKSALFAFQGDVYQGLAADELSAAEVRRCQKHIRILSGLYGVLRPLDLIQPYRLEMGTKLQTPTGKDLYSYWGSTIRDAISNDLRKLKASVIVNLASNEYSRAAQLTKIEADVIAPSFKDWKNGQYKMISFFAKRARGMMARHLMSANSHDIDTIQAFSADGYSYNPKLSKELEPVFTRKQA